jgi:hypothetical protein
VPGRTDSIVGFDPTVRPPVPTDLMRALPPDLPLTIRVLPRDGYVDSHTVDLGPPTRIAGHGSWYLTTDGRGWVVPPGGSVLAVNVGRRPETTTRRELS